MGAMIAPGFAQFDFLLTKNTYATEHVKVEFRAEAFNLLNRPNFGLPDGMVFDEIGSVRSDAGRITSTRTERQIQLSLKISFKEKAAGCTLAIR